MTKTEPSGDRAGRGGAGCHPPGGIGMTAPPSRIMGDDELRDLVEDHLVALASLGRSDRPMGLIWDSDHVPVGADPQVTRTVTYVHAVEPDPLLVRIPFCELAGMPAWESGGDVLLAEAVFDGRLLRWRIAEWRLDLAEACIIAVLDFEGDLTA